MLARQLSIGQLHCGSKKFLGMITVFMRVLLLYSTLLECARGAGPAKPRQERIQQLAVHQGSEINMLVRLLFQIF